MADQENFQAGHPEGQTPEKAGVEASHNGQVSDTIRDVRGFLGIPDGSYVRGLSSPDGDFPVETLMEGDGDDFTELPPVDPEAIPSQLTWRRPETAPISWLHR